jgi:outer membrane protein OmpA-like peptidoglycan-associated protein
VPLTGTENNMGTFKLAAAGARTLLAGLALASGLAGAQDAPSTEQMIEQLRPPRTRSLRNLAVEPAPEAGRPGAGPVAAASTVAVPDGRPSLSLQIQFGFDSAEVQAPSRAALRNLARALQSPDLAGSRFAIEGHTDAKGRPDYNLRLSQRRAEAVRDVLAGQGVDGTRLVAAGKGSSEPADAKDPYAPVNRRVRVVNLD